MSELSDEAGWWFMYHAKANNQWDQTAIGCAIYRRNDGKLMGSKFDTLDRAIDRGDLLPSAAGCMPNVPPTLERMERTIESIGNAMSCLTWSGPMGIILGTEHTTIDALFDRVVGGAPISSLLV